MRSLYSCLGQMIFVFMVFGICIIALLAMLQHAHH